MAHPGARRPPADLINQQPAVSVATQRSNQEQQPQYYCQRNGPVSSPSIVPPLTTKATSGAPSLPPPPPVPAASSKGASAASSRSNATSAGSELVRPHYRGHQRRQSVARLLPDISKLRLLSWLVEASNELINCDIAIMDGVYAKLNRSRESLLFWQQQSQQQQQQQQQRAGGISSRAPPPPPPAVQPVANKTVISRRQEQLLASKNSSSAANQRQQQVAGSPAHNHRNKLFNQKRSVDGTAPGNSNNNSSGSTSASRSHHSLPLTNYDSSSLAAVSMRSSLSNTNKSTNTADTDSITGSMQSQSVATTPSASESIEASIMLMMKQNLQQHQQQRHSAIGAAGQPTTTGARNNCSLPIRLSGAPVGGGLSSSGNAQQQASGQAEPADYCDDTSNQSDDEDDDNSSATSSTTSSGIHGASSSAASSTSSSGASSVDSSCSLDGLSVAALDANSIRGSTTFTNRAATSGGGGEPTTATTNASANATTTTASSAEQLSERIRRAVMEHNYLQNLLVNVIRQHDRQRERHEVELMALRQPQSLDAYGRPPSASSGGGSLEELPRIDLASIADALNDGCQCSCHHSRLRYASNNTPPPSSGLETSGNSNNNNNNRASTLPTSSSLSLFQPANLVPTRKNRRKKHSEPSREDLIKRLSDKLCESCFETHYWLHSCVAIESPIESQQHQQQQVASGAASATNDNTSANDPHDHHHQQSTPATGTSVGGGSTSSGKAASQASAGNLDSIVALRNATFIRLVQQQVRATISNSIELIDLIRREIKSPESIKQKQLMRCFSASIKLLSSVASYVVPSQDISTFITTEMVPGQGGGSGGGKFSSKAGGANQSGGGAGQQQTTTTLFNLPPSDFDHILLYPHHHHQHSAASPGEAFLSNHHRAHHATSHSSQQQQASNYHLAQAPEIPLRRRHNQQQRQRRSFDEACTQDRLQQHPRVHLLSRDQQSASGSFRSLPPNVTSNSLLSSADKLDPDELESLTGSTTGVNNSDFTSTNTNPNGGAGVESSSGASSNNSSASSSIARGQVQQSSLKAQTNSSAILDGKSASHELASPTFGAGASILQRHHHQSPHHSPSTFDNDDFALFQSGRAKFWQSSKFNFIKKLLQVKQQRLLRQQSKDRRIYNNKVANKFRLVMMDLIHFNKSQQLLTTENGVNSLLTSMRNVLEFGLYLTVKLY